LNIVPEVVRLVAAVTEIDASAATPTVICVVPVFANCALAVETSNRLHVTAAKNNSKGLVMRVLSYGVVIVKVKVVVYVPVGNFGSFPNWN
jgi:hypothetical protein